MGETLIGEINGVKHYQDGHYEYDGGKGDVSYGGRLTTWFDVISVDFNKLKGKLFNLVEATVTDKAQADAVKGLIRGFCNDSFLETDSRLHSFFTELGFYNGGSAAALNRMMGSGPRGLGALENDTKSA